MRLLIAVCLIILSSGCERKLSDAPFPLRPLVYTEAASDEDEKAAAAALSDRFRSPDDLGLGLHRALLTHDRALFEDTFASPEEWAKAVGSTDIAKVSLTVKQTVEGSEDAWLLFTPAHPSEAPIGGLSSRLQLLSFDLGKGYDLRGKPAASGQEQQFYSNRLRLQLRGTDKIFSIPIPKIILTENGWKIAKEPIGVDPALRTYLEAGMHLKPELLQTDHYPYPFAVGNFWKYRVHETGTIETADTAANKAAKAAAKNPPPEKKTDVLIVRTTDELTAATAAASASSGTSTVPELTMRVAVTSVETFNEFGYWLATLEQTYNDPDRPPVITRYLATPRRIYRCNNECQKKIHNVSFILTYIAKQTPLFVFPLPEGEGWGEAGQKTNNRQSAYTVEEGFQIAQVPAGDFNKARIIVQNNAQGRESRYFVAGTGVVLRKFRAGAGEVVEELIHHRLMH